MSEPLPSRHPRQLLALLAALFIVSGCSLSPQPHTRDPQRNVRTRVTTIASDNGVLQLSYPVVTADSTNADALNNAIQTWIGQTCPLPDTDEGNLPSTHSARQCLAAMQNECSDMPDIPSPQSVCGMRSEISVATNAPGILALMLTGSVYNGGPHGASYRIYRNLSVANAGVIPLSAIVAEPDGVALRSLIEAQLRQQYQLAKNQPLTAAGFYRDRIPATDNFLIQPTGLRFTYQPYEIAPYALGEPTAFITYDRLRPLLKAAPPFDTAQDNDEQP